MVMSGAMTQSYEKCEENRVDNDTCGILTGWRMQTPAGPNGTNPTAIKNGRSFAATASAQQVSCKTISDINLQSSSFRIKQFSVIIFYWILYLFLCIFIDQLIMKRITWVLYQTFAGYYGAGVKDLVIWQRILVESSNLRNLVVPVRCLRILADARSFPLGYQTAEYG